MLNLIKLIGGNFQKYAPIPGEYHFNGERHIKVKALKTWKISNVFGNFIVKKGDISGFIKCRTNRENEDLPFHLPHDDNSWITGNTRLSDLGKIKGNSWAGGDSIISGCAVVDDSIILNSAQIKGRTQIYRSIVSGTSIIDGSLKACSLHTCEINDNSSILGSVVLTACQTYNETKIINTSPMSSINIGFAIFQGNTCIDLSSSIEQHKGHPYDDMNISNCTIKTIRDLEQAINSGRIKKRQDGKTRLDAVQRNS